MTDLISRQAAIDAVGFYSLHSGDKLLFADKPLKELPSVQPERKKGKWIVYKAPDAYHCGLIKCQFCGEEMIAEPDEYNFCPNCGADMRGEEE